MNKEKLRDVIEGGVLSAVIQFLILASAVVFVLESDRDVWGLTEYTTHFMVLDWVFFVLFSVEYMLRVYIEPRKRDFIFSFLRYN